MIDKESFRLKLNRLLICISIMSMLSISVSGSTYLSKGNNKYILNNDNYIDKGPQLGSYNGGGSSTVGISAYVNVGSIDIASARSIFKTIDYEDADTILGTYYLSTGYTGGENVYLYVTRDGYIVAFYTNDQPASRLIQWTSSTTIASKFAGVIQDVGRYLGYDIDYRNIKYYDFRYPNANRIFVATKSATEGFFDNYGNPYLYSNFKFNIPSNAEIYEVSYSMYLSSYSYPSGSNVAIDTNPVGSVTGVSGSITTQYGSYNGYILQGQDHLFGIMGNSGDEAAGALVVIYKDPSISVKGPDYYWDGNLEYTGKNVGQTGYIESTPTPIPTHVPTSKVTVPVPIPTESEGEEIGAPTPTSAPPESSDTSINLYGERTDVELGQDVLLKLSAVNYIFKKEPLHAQIILIPPSGMSVTATGFVGSGTSQYVTNFDLQPGDNKNIEINIKSNQEGTFKVTGRIAYYFGDDKDKGVVRDQDLTIKVRPVSGNIINTPSTRSSQGGQPEATPKKKLIPGFEMIFSIISIFSLTITLRYRK